MSTSPEVTSDMVTRKSILVGVCIAAILFCGIGPFAIFSQINSQRAAQKEMLIQAHDQLVRVFGIHFFQDSVTPAELVKKGGQMHVTTTITFTPTEMINYVYEFPNAENPSITLNPSYLSPGRFELLAYDMDAINFPQSEITRLEAKANDSKTPAQARIPYYFVLERIHQLTPKNRFNFAMLLLNSKMPEQAATRYKIHLLTYANTSNHLDKYKEGAFKIYNKLPSAQQTRAKSIWPPELIP